MSDWTYQTNLGPLALNTQPALDISNDSLSSFQGYKLKKIDIMLLRLKSAIQLTVAIMSKIYDAMLVTRR